MSYCANGGWRAGKAGRDRRSACSVAWGSDLWTLKLSPGWAGGCGATACVSVLQGKPKRGGWCGDATSGLLGRRSALFKPALQAVIVRGVAGAQWGERGAAMGYGLPAPGSRLSAPWRLGDAGARCVCLLDRVSMRLAVRMPRALYMCKHGRSLRADQGTRRTHTIALSSCLFPSDRRVLGGVQHLGYTHLGLGDI